MNFKHSKSPGGIRPYYIGLSVLGVFAFAMFLVVVFQGINGRQDVTTAAQASKIADKLNTYTDSHSSVPSSLSDIGFKDVPKTITYDKISSTSYKFCATYRSGVNSFSATSVENGLSQFSSGGTLPSATTGISADPSGTVNYLDVSTHHKGNNCQTVTMYSSGFLQNGTSGSGDNSGNGSATSDPCTYPTNDSSDAAYQKYVDCENNYYNSLNSTTPSTPTTKT
jgi:hypothetical protein